MAGIVGYVGSRQAGPILLRSLRKLEHLGYDSSGFAVGTDEAVHVRQATGSLRDLQAAARLDPVRGSYGIGRTGWTAGAPCLAALPRPVDAPYRGVYVALTGRPTNLHTLRSALPRSDRHRAKATAETVGMLLGRHVGAGSTLEEAVRSVAGQLQGNCVLAAIRRDEPGSVVVASLGLTALIGLGRNENFFASDLPTLLNWCQNVVRLERGDLAVLTARGVLVTDADARPVSRPVRHMLWDPASGEKSGYKHFMLKEIFEQPRSIRETILSRMDQRDGAVFLDELGVTPGELRNISHLNLVGSGSSWHAGLAAKFMLERMNRIHVAVEYGSEFRFSDPVIDDRVLSLFISQSGETADAIASQELAQSKGAKTIAICNSVDSTLALRAHGAIYTNAGPELAAESTKSFVSQLAALYLFSMYLAQVTGRLAAGASEDCARRLRQLPRLAESALELAGRCERIARQVAPARQVTVLGRGIHYPVALEGARKLQELAQIQALGCPAGEMRHGPAAIVDDGVVVIVLATMDEGSEASRRRYEKTLAQVREVKSRQARVLCVANEGDRRIARHAHEVIGVPPTDELLQPILNIIPLQLLAYYTAVRLGRAIDQPTDITKKVTSA